MIADARRISGEPEDSTYVPEDAREFSNRIFHTCYMGTENSSVETRSRAKELGAAIGSYHIDLNMDTVVTAVRSLFAFVTGIKPKFKIHGGTTAENLALQNIQVCMSMCIRSCRCAITKVYAFNAGSPSYGTRLFVCATHAFCSRPVRWPSCSRKCQC